MDAIGRSRCHEQLLDERTHHLEKEGKILLLQGSDYGTSLLLSKNTTALFYAAVHHA